MAEKKKTIIDEAILDIEAIQEALMNNTKEILRSTMKEEIANVVKESLTEAEYDEEDVDDLEGGNVEDVVTNDDEITDEPGTDDVDITPDTDVVDNAEETSVEEPVADASDELPMVSSDGEEEFDTMDMTGASNDEVISVFKKLNGEDEIEVISDKEVKITDPQSGAEYQIKLGDDSVEEPVVEPEMGLDSEIGEEPTMDLEPEMELDDEENIYEVTIEEDIIRGPGHDVKNGSGEVKDSPAPNSGDIEGQTAEKDKEITGDNLTGGFPEDEATTGDGHAEHVMGADGKTGPETKPTVSTSKPAEETTNGSEGNHGDHVMEGEETDEEEVEEIDEAIPVGNAQARREPGRNTPIKGAGAKQPTEWSPEIKETVAKYNSLLKEAKSLKAENENFKEALGKFRTTLGETVVYNSNLTYVTKLFMEHSTTKEEKENIMKRFDEEVSTVKESKALYKSINAELKNKKTVVESVDKKINNSVKPATSNLNESTVYADPSTSAIRDLINRVEGR